MDKTVIGLVGAITALTSLDAAQAAQPPAQNLAEVMQVESYDDLLKPIPNALALLRADEARRAETAATQENGQEQGEVQLAQWHHHHHHHRWWRRWWYYHHHHHHHHHRYWYHHHHHHHHHHHY